MITSNSSGSHTSIAPVMLKPSDHNFMMDKIGHREMLSYEEDTVDSDDEGHSDDDDEEEATDEDDDTTEE